MSRTVRFTRTDNLRPEGLGLLALAVALFVALRPRGAFWDIAPAAR